MTHIGTVTRQRASHDGAKPRFSASHAELPEIFYDKVSAAAFPKHILRYRNQKAAETVGLQSLSDDQWIEHFGRFAPFENSFPQPLALRYHGHQFRHYNPDLGDGRGFLFAQLYDLNDGRLLDFGTKGSGQTPWSRAGDGRLTLKGGVREILATAMLEALGVNTSKSFSLIETGEDLVRNDEPSPTRSAVLVRLSHSHIRIGTFQRQAYLGDTAAISRLLEYTIQTYMPEIWHDEEAKRAVAFLAEISARVAKLGAQWMLAGFVHGVLNTDNINVTGESFDYGPWRFLPRYDPAFTAAYFDHSGLYAYGRQPDTLLWNLVRLAECLLPLAAQADLEKTLDAFAPAFRREMDQALCRRLGILPAGDSAAASLGKVVWPFLHASQMPFEAFFFDWYGGTASTARAMQSARAVFYEEARFAPVRDGLVAFSPMPGIGLEHSYFAQEAACTMLIDEVEHIWSGIATDDDWGAFHRKLGAIEAMRDAYEQKPRA